MAKRVTFYQRPGCAACNRARDWLFALGDVVVMERDILRDPPPESLLRQHLPGEGDRLRDCLDAGSAPYRRHRLAGDLPGREALLHLMAREPELIRRPLVVRGGRAVFGFDEDSLRGLLD